MASLRARWLRALALIVLGLAIGLAGAYAYSRSQSKVYRAEVSLVAQTGAQPVTGGVLRTIADLVRTDIVAQNVIQDEQLQETPGRFLNSLHVGTRGAVITVGVDNGSESEAVNIAQELSIVFTQLVRDRFGSTSDSAEVSIFDPAHSVGQVAPLLDRDLGWGALFGGLLGLLAANVFVLRGRRGVWAPLPYGYETLPALGPASSPALTVAPPSVLGTTDAEIADAIVARAADEHFQTVLVVGDETGRISAGIALALANRGGGMAIWIRSDDADVDELERLAARCAFVLVAAPDADAKLAALVDVVVAVTEGAAAPSWPGVRLLGTIAR
jgi:hypothetical protein